MNCVMLIPTIHPVGISDWISFVLGGAVASSLCVGFLLVLVFLPYFVRVGGFVVCLFGFVRFPFF